MAFGGLEDLDLAKWSQVMIGAVMGAFVAVMFRRPISWIDWIAMAGSSFCIGALAAEWVAGWLGLPMYQAAGLSAGLGLTIYQGVRKALDTFDFNKILPWPKEKDE